MRASVPHPVILPRDCSWLKNLHQWVLFTEKRRRIATSLLKTKRLSMKKKKRRKKKTFERSPH